MRHLPPRRATRFRFGGTDAVAVLEHLQRAVGADREQVERLLVLDPGAGRLGPAEKFGICSTRRTRRSRCPRPGSTFLIEG